MPAPLALGAQTGSCLTLFLNDARHIQAFREEFYRIERHMAYRQPNLLWGTLALSRPIPLPDNACLYSVDLPKPVFLCQGEFPACADGTRLPDGAYTGRVTLRLSDARFAPAFKHIDNKLAIERRDGATTAGLCEVTLRLEGLRFFRSCQPVSDPSLPEQFIARACAALATLRHNTVDALTALLSPDSLDPHTAPLLGT